MKSKLKKISNVIKKNNERDARTSLIEELFYDFNRSRAQVYLVNFVRGLFFGAGSVIGGTLIIGLVIWLLTIAGNVIPPLGSFFDGITNTLQSREKQ